jgi:hypothetical protein
MFLYMAASAAEPIPIYDLTGDFLLGSAAPWRAANAVAPSLGERAYRVVGLDGVGATLQGEAPRKMEPPPEDVWQVDFQPSVAPPETVDRFALAGEHDPLPRPVRAAALDQPAYREAASAVLAELGLPGVMPELDQLFRVDLDGDGNDEVLASLSHYGRGLDERTPGPGAAAGDYSVVFLRHLVDGEVRTEVLSGVAFPEAEDYIAPLQYSVAAVLDIDGDGVMEVILRDRYYEGIGAIIYRFSDAGLEQVLSGGWGF